jgi:fatty acid desaturase
MTDTLTQEKETADMEPKKEAMLIAGMSGVAVLLSLAGLVAVLASGMGLSIDAIFLALVCLSMGGVFSLMMLWHLKSAGLLPDFKKAEKPAGAAGESAKEESQ